MISAWDRVEVIRRSGSGLGHRKALDLAQARFRLVVSGDFERYAPITDLEQLSSLRTDC
jgi:hypothetical protein